MSGDTPIVSNPAEKRDPRPLMERLRDGSSGRAASSLRAVILQMGPQIAAHFSERDYWPGAGAAITRDLETLVALSADVRMMLDAQPYERSFATADRLDLVVYGNKDGTIKVTSRSLGEDGRVVRPEQEIVLRPAASRGQAELAVRTVRPRLPVGFVPPTGAVTPGNYAAQVAAKPPGDLPDGRPHVPTGESAPRNADLLFRKGPLTEEPLARPVEMTPLSRAIAEVKAGAFPIYPVGSVVMLRSGGPQMTVVAHRPQRSGATTSGWAECEWWSGDGERKSADIFPEAALALAVPPRAWPLVRDNVPPPEFPGFWSCCGRLAVTGETGCPVHTGPVAEPMSPRHVVEAGEGTGPVTGTTPDPVRTVGDPPVKVQRSDDRGVWDGVWFIDDGGGDIGAGAVARDPDMTAYPHPTPPSTRADYGLDPVPQSRMVDATVFAAQVMAARERGGADERSAAATGGEDGPVAPAAGPAPEASDHGDGPGSP